MTDTAIKAAKPRDKGYKLFDAHGLFLWVDASGGRWWRLKYRRDGRENSLSLGTYPDVSLAIAREKRDVARRLIASGGDPSAARKARKEDAVNTFQAIAYSDARQGNTLRGVCSVSIGLNLSKARRF